MLTHKLSDCKPQWFEINGTKVLSLLCPHCLKVYLSIGIGPVTIHDQLEFWSKLGREDIVLFNPTGLWVVQSNNIEDFNTLSTSPSLDASASGHAHFTIQNGILI